jgi:hypothetical protein
VGPASISRDPFYELPMAPHGGWKALRAQLEAEILANATLGS